MVKVNPALPDLLCDFPLKSEVFSLATHPREPVISIGLAKGHVTTIRLPQSSEWPDKIPPLGMAASAMNESESASVSTQKKKKKRVSISSKILSATPSSNLPLTPPSRLKNIFRPKNLVDILWQTRRHKVSCRDLAFSIDGEVLFSGGGDSILKASSAETGKVITKILLPPPENSLGQSDVPVVLRTLSPQTLLIGTESTALHVLDLRCRPSGKAVSRAGNDTVSVFESVRLSATYHPHPTDFISSISLVPPSGASTSGYSKQWITAGGGTLALTDLRKGIIFQSDNHYRDFLSSLVINPRTGGSRTEKVVASSDFSSSIPIFDKTNLNIEIGNLKCVDIEDSIDAMTISPSSFQAIHSEGDGDVIACATSSGYVRFVATTLEARRAHGLSGGDPSIADFPHAELESVTAVNFDVHGRMIVGGGHTVRVWSEIVNSDSQNSNYDDGTFEGPDSRESDLDSESDENPVMEAKQTVIPEGLTVKRKKSGSKLLLSDAWKFNPDLQANRRNPVNPVTKSEPDDDDDGVEDASHVPDANSGTDSDTEFTSSRQARKKRKHSTNLPSRGTSISFSGLD